MTLAPLAVGRERRYVGIHQTAKKWIDQFQVCHNIKLAHIIRPV